jgi:hypothetical protein
MVFQQALECKVLHKPRLDYQQLWPLQMALNDWALARGVPLLKLEWERVPQPALCFRVTLDRDTIAQTLAQSLPADLVVDVLIDGESWAGLRRGAA